MSGIGRTEKFEYLQSDGLLYFGKQPVAKNHVNFLLVTQCGQCNITDLCTTLFSILAHDL